MTQKEFIEEKSKTPWNSTRGHELAWIEMVCSCFCYGQVGELKKYRKAYANYGITMKRIKELEKEQLDYLNANGKIRKNSCMTSDGELYNTLIW